MQNCKTNLRRLGGAGRSETRRGASADFPRFAFVDDLSRSRRSDEVALS